MFKWKATQERNKFPVQQCGFKFEKQTGPVQWDYILFPDGSPPHPHSLTQMKCTIRGLMPTHNLSYIALRKA